MRLSAEYFFLDLLNTAMSKCRVCFLSNVRMHLISGTWYKEMYEKQSGAKISIKNGVPDTICYICNAKLLKFLKFFCMAQKAERNLIYYFSGIDTQQDIEDRMKLFHNLTMTSTQSMSYIHTGEDEEPEVTVTIKEEPIDYEENEDFMEEYLDTEALNDEAIENTQIGSTELPKTSPGDVKDYQNNLEEFTNDKQINSQVLIKEEFTDDKTNMAEVIRNLSLALDMPLRVPNYPHMNAVKSNRDYKYYCNTCGYKSQTGRGLKRHSKLHNSSYKFVCEFCLYRFESENKLGHHRNFCTVCSICGRRFSNIHGLRIHVRLHTGIQPYTCDACGRGFNQKTNLKTHLRVHTREKQYPCEICPKIFPFKSFLTRHMLLHNDNADFESFRRLYNCHKLYRKKKAATCVCSICGKLLQSLKGLESHMKLHSGERPFACELCDRVFIQKCNLLSHVERLHAKDPSVSCEVCHRAFPLNSELKAHLITHIVSSAKDFEICQQKHIYRIHNSIHTGQVTPYTCDMCTTRVLSY